MAAGLVRGPGPRTTIDRATSRRSSYEQVAATIFTDSTLNFGSIPAADDDAGGVADVVLDAGLAELAELDSSTVPVTSTLWPTCGLSFDASASSRYFAAGFALPVVPTVPVPAGLALVRMNAGVAVLAVDVDAAALESLGAFSIQPENVTCFAVLVCAAELLGVCAARAAVTVETIATASADRSALRIATSSCCLLQFGRTGSSSSKCNHNANSARRFWSPFLPLFELPEALR